MQPMRETKAGKKDRLGQGKNKINVQQDISVKSLNEFNIKTHDEYD